jgi:hypothetical protein
MAKAKLKIQSSKFKMRLLGDGNRKSGDDGEALNGYIVKKESLVSIGPATRDSWITSPPNPLTTREACATLD